MSCAGAWRCRRALALRDRRSSPQGRSRTCHSCALRELVEAENAGERLALLAFLVDDLLGRHRWQLKLRGPMDVRKWPRKNDPESIRARQEALGLDGEVTGIDLEPFARAQEMLTGAAVIPVSVVGPLELELGEYELREPDGRARRDGPRAGLRLRAARAHRRAGSRRRSTAARARSPSRAGSAPTCSPTGSRAPRASSAARRARRSSSRAGSTASSTRCARGWPSRTTRRCRSTRGCAR